MAETKTTKKTETTAKAEPKKVAPKTTAKATTAKATTAKKTSTKATTEAKKTPAKVEEVKVEVVKEVVQAKEPAKKANGPMLKITLVKSASGRLEKQRRTLEALALRKIGHSTVKPDNAQTRGMIFVVKHLVSVESVKEN